LPTIVIAPPGKRQRDWTLKRIEFCNALIAKKIEGCILRLEKSLRRSEAWERAMQRAYADLSRLELDP
jgi:hypothetical protein